MKRLIYQLIRQDIYLVTHQKRFWLLIAIGLALLSYIFLGYLDEFLSLQQELRAKKFRYGVDAVVLLPYLKTFGLIAAIPVVFLSARQGYRDMHSSYRKVLVCQLMQCRHGVIIWLMAKCCVIVFLSVLMVSLTTVPVVVFTLLYSQDDYWILTMLMGLMTFYIALGLSALAISLVIKSTIVTGLFLTGFCIGLEIIYRLIVEPLWLTDIIGFYSPIEHLNQLSVGVLNFSSLIFGFIWIVLMLLICYRLFITKLSQLH